MALPAAATAAAYLNARWALSHDLGLIKTMVKIASQPAAAEKNDRLNFFYALENRALSPTSADHEFIVYNGQSWTFRETYSTVLHYGTWLKQVHNVQPKDVVAIDSMNSANFLFLVLGVWSIGAVPALINYNLAGKPLTHTVRVSTAKLLLVDDEVRNCFPSEQLEIFASSGFRDGKGPVEVVFLTPDVEPRS